jgi:hypothetical protein
VVDELPELHEHERVAAVQVRHVGVHHDRHEAGARQRVAAQGAESRTGDGCKNSRRDVIM